MVHLGVSSACYPQIMFKYFSIEYLMIPKQKLAAFLNRLKKWFLGPFGRVSGGVVPPNYVQIFVSLISPDIKKSSTLA